MALIVCDPKFLIHFQLSYVSYAVSLNTYVNIFTLKNAWMQSVIPVVMSMVWLMVMNIEYWGSIYEMFTLHYSFHHTFIRSLLYVPLYIRASLLSVETIYAQQAT